MLQGFTSFEPISYAKLDNTVIVFIGDNGSFGGKGALPDIGPEEAKTTIYEGGVRIPMIIADGRSVQQDVAPILPGVAPLYVDRDKLNIGSPQLVHVVDLYKTIVLMADPAAWLSRQL